MFYMRILEIVVEHVKHHSNYFTFLMMFRLDVYILRVCGILCYCCWCCYVLLKLNKALLSSTIELWLNKGPCKLSRNQLN